MKTPVLLGFRFILLVAPFASAQGPGIIMMGIGMKSCANWQSSSEKSKEGAAWIFGYWSGLNTINPKNRKVGSQTDAYGIEAEVKKVCNDKPSLLLHEAVLTVYSAMLDRK